MALLNERNLAAEADKRARFRVFHVGTKLNSPYPNGSYLIPLAANALSGWILYCACGSPHVCSQWRGMELKAYQLPDEYYFRGYGSSDEILSINPKWHDS